MFPGVTNHSLRVRERGKRDATALKKFNWAGNYKRKIVRMKERKRVSTRKKRKIQEKKHETRYRPRKKQVSRFYFFSFIDSHI